MGSEPIESSQLYREAAALGVPVRSRFWAVTALLDGTLPADFKQQLADDAAHVDAAEADARCDPTTRLQIV